MLQATIQRVLLSDALAVICMCTLIGCVADCPISGRRRTPAVFPHRHLHTFLRLSMEGQAQSLRTDASVAAMQAELQALRARVRELEQFEQRVKQGASHATQCALAKTSEGTVHRLLVTYEILVNVLPHSYR